VQTGHELKFTPIKRGVAVPRSERGGGYPQVMRKSRPGCPASIPCGFERRQMAAGGFNIGFNIALQNSL